MYVVSVPVCCMVVTRCGLVPWWSAWPDIGPSPNQEDSEKEDSDEDDEEEEEERTNHITETEFDFKDFMDRLVNPKVVRACDLLLRDFMKNSDFTNRCVLKLLHRIAWDSKYPSMVFQASIFRTFQEIFHSKYPNHKELVKFATFIVKKFTEVAVKNPKAFMEILFWKNSRDAYEMENGYDANENKAIKNAWNEEQEEELRKLYMENQTNPTTEMDVIDWILENLVDQTKTRRGVIKKLKELGLIFKAPTKKSNAMRTKVPQEFREDEDEILRSLWKQFSSAQDPLAALIPRMPLKRPKHRYVDRLLELGIISDKKECRKKRGKKHNAGHQDEASSDSDGSASEDSSSRKRTNKTPTLSSKKNSRKESKSQGSSSAMTSTEVVKSLIDAVNAGLVEPLKWVIESLEELALDQEAEGFDPESESVPLVPMMEDCINAMEDPLFLTVLKSLGIHPPLDEQATYWRIPGHIHHESLRKRNETIKKAIEGSLIVAEESVTAVSVETSTGYVAPAESSSEDDEEFFKKLRGNQNKSMGENNTSVIKDVSSKQTKRKRSDSSDAGMNISKKVGRNNVIEDDSDSDQDEISHSINKSSSSADVETNKSIDTTDNIPNKYKNIQNSQSLDSSDSENNVTVIENRKYKAELSRDGQNSSEDNASGSRKKRCLAISDDSDDSNHSIAKQDSSIVSTALESNLEDSPVKVNKKRKAVIFYDSDEENVPAADGKIVTSSSQDQNDIFDSLL